MSSRCMSHPGPHGGEQSGSTSCVGRSLASCGLSLQPSVLYTWKINHSSLIQSHMRSWTLPMPTSDMTCFTEITVLKHSRSARHAVRSSSAAWPLANKAQLMANCGRNQQLRVRDAWSIAHVHKPSPLSTRLFGARQHEASRVFEHAFLVLNQSPHRPVRGQTSKQWLRLLILARRD